MEILRHVVVLLHITGFAILFGSWFVEAMGKRRFTTVMNIGLLVAGIAGLILAAPWGVDGPMNYMKIGIKLGVLIVIGALIGIGLSRSRKGNAVPPAMFWTVGVLTLGNAAIAVLW